MSTRPAHAAPSRDRLLVDQRRSWRLLREYLGSRVRRIPIVTLLSVVAALCQVSSLVLLAATAVGVASKQHQVRVAPGPFVFHLSVATAMIVAAAAAVGIIGVQALNGWVTSGLVTDAQRRCRQSVLEAYLGSSWEYVSRERRGELQQLLTVNVAKVAQAVSFLNILVFSTCNVVILVTVAIVINPFIALALGIGVNILAIPLRPLKKRTRHSAEHHGKAEGDFAAYVAQVVEHARETQVFEVAGGVTAFGNPLARRVAGAQRQVQFLLWTVPSTYAGIALLGLTAAVATLASLNLSDLSSTGALVLLLLRSLTYGQSVQVSLQGLAEAQPYLRELDARRNTYLAHPRQSGYRPIEAITSIELRQVSYSYGGNGTSGQLALDRVDLAIPGGALVGVVGPTGSGKSTLAQILLRLREPVSGSYLVNGVDAREYDRAAWARVVAFVPQEPMIVDGTIADNIRFFRPWIDDEAIREAARAAHISDEIEEMPDGFATRLSGISVALSGGQRQRLCIARALVGAPQLLVLDEPTSALDMRSEAKFQRTIESLVGRTTVVVIAHRVATIRSCERIVVVERSQIKAYDTPERLIGTGGFYAEIAGLSSG